MKQSKTAVTSLAAALATTDQPFGATMIEKVDFGPRGPSAGFDESLAERVPQGAVLSGFHAGRTRMNMAVSFPATFRKLAPAVMDPYSLAVFAICHGMEIPKDIPVPTAGEELATAIYMGKQISDFFLTKVVH